MSDLIDITNVKVAVDELGEHWINFEKIMIPEQAEIFNTSYNLITLAVRECALPLDITDVLNDEMLDSSSLIAAIRQIFLVYLTDILNNMGVIVDKDFVDANSLPLLNNIVNVIYTLDDVEDVMGLCFVLENQTYTNKERLVEIIKRNYDLDDDGEYPLVIKDVSPNVIQGLLMGLGAYTIDDIDDYVNPDVATRIKSNKEFLKGTIGEKHIIDGGGNGLSYEALSNLYINELSAVMVKDTKQYYKEVLSILIISGLTDEEIESGYESMIKDFSSDLEELLVASKMIEEVVLK